ncbi:MAG: endonuclease/exonuclease/phosphatase family protein, partial [Duncaniella sp.]|nr:endonuclease/exonuclease/phosphatase family protein [Duncaniella sp.]
TKYIFRPLRLTANMLMLIVNILAALLMIASAYGGTVDPYRSAIPAILAMMFPYITTGCLILLVADSFFFRKTSLVIVAAIIICLPPLLTFSPVNLPHAPLTENEKERSFTFLTYNVLHFWDCRGVQENLSSNATIDYILSTDADIVNLQEVEFVKTWPLWKVTPEQIQLLAERYPYRLVNVSNQLAFLSKYPFERVELTDADDYLLSHMALFKMNVEGRRLYVFDVHLKSIGLNPEDKELYMSLTKDTPRTEAALRRELGKVKHQLLSKLASAFRLRADQARYIRRFIDEKLQGCNVIVAGDFNDIPGCYAIRTIMGDDISDAYRQNALGPTITYHLNRFHFRIDHVLYRGDMEAVNIHREPVPSSDHYPLLTTFVWDKE